MCVCVFLFFVCIFVCMCVCATDLCLRTMWLNYWCSVNPICLAAGAKCAVCCVSKFVCACVCMCVCMNKCMRMCNQKENLLEHSCNSKAAKSSALRTILATSAKANDLVWFTFAGVQRSHTLAHSHRKNKVMDLLTYFPRFLFSVLLFCTH